MTRNSGWKPQQKNWYELPALPNFGCTDQSICQHEECSTKMRMNNSWMACSSSVACSIAVGSNNSMVWRQFLWPKWRCSTSLSVGESSFPINVFCLVKLQVAIWWFPVGERAGCCRQPPWCFEASPALILVISETGIQYFWPKHDLLQLW